MNKKNMMMMLELMASPYPMPVRGQRVSTRNAPRPLTEGRGGVPVGGGWWGVRRGGEGVGKRTRRRGREDLPINGFPSILSSDFLPLSLLGEGSESVTRSKSKNATSEELKGERRERSRHKGEPIVRV